MNTDNFNTEMAKYIDEGVVSKVWLNKNSKERVCIYSKNGIWGIRYDYFSEHETEMCWCCENEGVHLYDSEETAIKELYASYPWAKEIHPKIL